MADDRKDAVCDENDKCNTITTVETAADHNTAEDAELEDILEDALQDFDKQQHNVRQPCCAAGNTSPSTASCLPTNTTCTSTDTTTCKKASDPGSSSGSSKPAVPPRPTPAAATASTTGHGPAAPAGFPDMKEMEALIMSLMSGDTSLLSQQLGGLDLGLDLDDTEAGSGPGSDFAETIQRTLGDLAQSTQNLQSDDLSEEELMRLVSSLGADGIDGVAENSGGGTDDELLPMMQGMMKSLLSKDVLYPSLKEISTQYPSWLESHREQISHDDFERYSQQYRHMLTIVREFDAEQSTDADDVKRHRFERVLEVMQQMQSLGHPPKELVGEMPKGLNLDADGLPKLPAGLPSPEQCCVM